jgi:hypothetical protein
MRQWSSTDTGRQHIFSALTTHGRLSARDLSHKCHLPIKQVITGLATLTQCFLVFHQTTPDGRTSYQANTSAASNLVRVGRFTQLMQRKFGRDGVSILNHLLIFGHDSLHNLQKVLASEYGLTNGFDLENTTIADESEQYHPGSLRGGLKRLVEQEYLKKLRPAHFQTYSDTWRVAEVVVKASGNFSSAKGKKGKEQLDEAVRAEVDGMLRGEDVSSDAVVGNKRPLPEDAEVPAPKKPKRLNGTSSQATAVVDASSTKAVNHINVCN